MRQYVSFAELTRRLIDAWLEHSERSISTEAICRSILDLLRINMVLMVVDMQNKAPPDWRITFMKKYGIPTTLIDAEEMQRSRTLGSLSEMVLVSQHMVEVCQKAVTAGQPASTRINLATNDVRIACSRLVVPDPSRGAAWCVVLGEIHSISPVGRESRFDDTDLAIVQLLREGLSAREIGNAIEVSPRTVEHRVEKMKARAGVKGILPLLTIKA